MSMDYTKPLLVPAGSDALGQIGNEAGLQNYMYMYYKWQKPIASFRGVLPL